MSADLKDPSTAIPKGTLSAIITTSISYILILVFLGCTFVRYSTGTANYLEFNELCTNATNCKYGLINDYQTMLLTSNTSFLIYLGIFISAMSSSLCCYVAAPRIFQAFSKDDLFPFVSWFSKGHGPNNVSLIYRHFREKQLEFKPFRNVTIPEVDLEKMKFSLDLIVS